MSATLPVPRGIPRKSRVKYVVFLVHFAISGFAIEQIVRYVAVKILIYLQKVTLLCKTVNM